MISGKNTGLQFGEGLIFPESLGSSPLTLGFLMLSDKCELQASMMMAVATTGCEVLAFFPVAPLHSTDICRPHVLQEGPVSAGSSQSVFPALAQCFQAAWAWPLLSG